MFIFFDSNPFICFGAPAPGALRGGGGPGPKTTLDLMVSSGGIGDFISLLRTMETVGEGCESSDSFRSAIYRHGANYFGK